MYRSSYSWPAKLYNDSIYPEELEEGSVCESCDERVDLVPVEGVHSFHIAATLIHLTFQLQHQHNNTSSLELMQIMTPILMP